VKPFFTVEFCKDLVTIDTSTCKNTKDRAQLLANQLNAKLEKCAKIYGYEHKYGSTWNTEQNELDEWVALMVNPAEIKPKED